MDFRAIGHIHGVINTIMKIVCASFRSPKLEMESVYTIYQSKLYLIRPLLDNGLKGGNSESHERASICNHFGVCLYVCLSVIKLQVTVFDPAT